MLARRVLAAIPAVLLMLMLVLPATPATAGGGGRGGIHCGEIEAPSAARRVNAQAFCFAPRNLVVKPGDAVTFVNYDEADHTVTSTQGGWGAKFAAGGWFEIRFPKAGAYPYFCVLHPGMNGTVVVGDSTAIADLESPVVVNEGVSTGKAASTDTATTVAESKPLASSSKGTPVGASVVMVSLVPAVAVAAYALGRRRGRAEA